ncbi:unnamed protein product [Camellia sinensis]
MKGKESGRRADPHISYHIIALGHGSHTAALLSGGRLCCRDSSDLLCYGPLRMMIVLVNDHHWCHNLNRGANAQFWEF